MMIHAMVAVIQRRWVVAFRVYPFSTILGRLVDTLFPLLVGGLLAHWVFRGQISSRFASVAGSGNYMSFLVIGLIVHMIFAGVMLAVGRSFVEEQREGTLEAVFLTPVNRMALTLGVTGYQVLISIPSFIGLVLAAWLMGAQLPDANLGAALLIGVLGLLAIHGMSLILATVMLAMQEMFITQNTVLLAAYFFSGVLFPIEYLPEPLQWVSKLLPTTWMLMMLRRSLLSGHGPADYPFEFAAFGLLTLVVLGVGLSLLRRVERIALTRMSW